MNHDRSRLWPATLAILVLTLLIGCGRGDGDRDGPRSDDGSDSIADEAAESTREAEAAFDGTVAAAVEGTGTALAREAGTPVGREGTVDAPGGTVVVTTLATPVATVDIEGLGEAELAAAVQTAVDRALAAAESAGAAGRAAGEDGQVDPGESLLVEIEIAGAEDWLDEAERLLAAYREQFGDLAEQGRETVEDLEAQLGDLDAAMDALDGWAERAAAEATEVAGRLDSALATARARATERSERLEEWRERSRATLEALGDLARRTPRSRPADLPATLDKLADFGDTLRESLSDGEIDAVEREVLAELGAETAAGLREHGGPLLQRMAEEVERSLDAIERGDWDALREGLPSDSNP